MGQNKSAKNTGCFYLFGNVIQEDAGGSGGSSREHGDGGLEGWNLLLTSSLSPETDNCYALTPADRKPRVFLVLDWCVCF